MPQRFRALFVPHGVLAPHEDGCIALWTEDEYAEESLRQHLRAKESPTAGHEVRRWFSMCSDFALDHQGRMIVPPGLRDHAQITTEVLFFGVFDRVELWSKHVWEARSCRSGASGRELCKCRRDVPGRNVPGHPQPLGRWAGWFNPLRQKPPSPLWGATVVPRCGWGAADDPGTAGGRRWGLRPFAGHGRRGRRTAGVNAGRRGSRRHGRRRGSCRRCACRLDIPSPCRPRP